MCRPYGYPMLTAVSFLDMGDIVTKESFDWIFSNPKIITASSLIGRLMDDIKSHKVCNRKSYTTLLMFPISKFLVTFLEKYYM